MSSTPPVAPSASPPLSPTTSTKPQPHSPNPTTHATSARHLFKEVDSHGATAVGNENQTPPHVSTNNDDRHSSSGDSPPVLVGRGSVTPRQNRRASNEKARPSVAPAPNSTNQMPTLGFVGRKSSLGRKLEAAREYAEQSSPREYGGDGEGAEGNCEEEENDEELVNRLRYLRLPRGGYYVKTCVGPIQVGIPPETIKDCLGCGMEVPRHYIVPLERFNRQLGSSIGVNVAEFEFPAYYNFFFHRQSVNLIVDSKEVEEKIRIVFQETLFGPERIDPDVDFSSDYPKDWRPDIPKELQYFRKFGDTFLTIDMLLSFTHFNRQGVAVVEKQTPHGKVAVRICKSNMHGGEYLIREIYDENAIVEAGGEKPPPPGNAVLSGIISLPDHLRSSMTIGPDTSYFVPPMFGVTVLGSSHGFDPKGSTSGYVLWVNRRGVMIDPPPHSSSILEKNQIHPSVIDAVIVTHCHADHDAGTFQKILVEKRIVVMTTSTIYESFIRKYSALSGIDAELLRRSHKFRPVKIGEPIKLRGGTFNFFYTLHSIPCVGFEVIFGSKSMVFSADHMNDPDRIREMYSSGILSEGRRDQLLNFPWHHDAILHEAGIPPIHTPIKTLAALPDDVKARLHVVHVSASSIPAGSNLNVAQVGVENTIELQVDVPEFSEAISVLNLVGDIYFFSGLSLTHARGLLEVGCKKRYGAGDLITPKETRITDFSVLLVGILEVTYDSDGCEEQSYTVQWSMGDWFGEEVLLGRDNVRLAQEEIRALTDVELIVFAGNELHYLLQDTQIARRVKHLVQIEGLRLERLLTFNSTLKALTRSQKLHLESLAELMAFKEGEYVWRAGDAATFCVIIHDGSVSFEGKKGQLMKSVMRRSASQLVHGEAANVSQCPPSFEKGSFVGSVALVLHDKGQQTHNLLCNSDCTVLVFRADHLKEFFGVNPGVLLCLLDAHFVL